ncbi:MAG: hypothetical protein N4A38_02760 [Candidatus Gracilibacteria bacterium]|nr:hypothetical protein [Candidatus Gracilibacteria bacterium]
MKKIILFISILLSGIYLANFINAITVTKNSGEVLDNSTWTNISSLTDKIDVSSSDIKLNGKLYVTGELCSNIGGVKKCLGSCDDGYHWEQASLSCVPNNCTADTITSNTYNYSVPELNNGITSAVLTSTNYQDIANGKKYYTQAFLCNNGVIETSGSEGNNIVCNSGYTLNNNTCETAWVTVTTTANSARCPTIGPYPQNLAVCEFYWQGVYLFSKQIQNANVGIPNPWQPTSSWYTYQDSSYYYAINANCNSCGAIGGYQCSYALARKKK